MREEKEEIVILETIGKTNDAFLNHFPFANVFLNNFLSLLACKSQNLYKTTFKQLTRRLCVISLSSA